MDKVDKWSEKTIHLVGEDNYSTLRQAHVAVVGVGGVGSFAAEFLCRSGVGFMTLIDGDIVSESNRNRQIPALSSTQGFMKVDVMSSRLKDINPDALIMQYSSFLSETDADDFVTGNGNFSNRVRPYDFVVDAIDSVAPKVALLSACVRHNIPVVSAMGAAGKFNPELVKCCDISKTFQCGLAKAVRVRLAKEGIKHGVPVVFSPEVSDVAHLPQRNNNDKQVGRSIPGTISYMPAVFGCHLAAFVIQALIDS